MAQVERVQENKRGEAGKSANRGQTNDGWKGFVNVELSDKDKQAVKKLFEKYADAWGHILGRVAEGYKLTVSYDDPHTTWNVSLTCRALADNNLGLTLTGRGGSMQAACISLWYKDQYMLKGIWDMVALAKSTQLDVDDVG